MGGDGSAVSSNTHTNSEKEMGQGEGKVAENEAR